MKHPRLRDSKKLQTNEPYPLGELPNELIVRIGGHLAHLMYIGRKDISGSDWVTLLLMPLEERIWTHRWV